MFLLCGVSRCSSGAQRSSCGGRFSGSRTSAELNSMTAKINLSAALNAALLKSVKRLCITCGFALKKGDKPRQCPHCGADKCNLCDMGDDCLCMSCEVSR